MIINIKNKDLFFIMETIWHQLDYRFKFHINQLVSVNSADDHVQAVEADAETFMQCYSAISNKGYGYTCGMADLLIEDLRQQVIDNIADPEYAALALLMQQAKNADDATYEAKCQSGKELILA